MATSDIHYTVGEDWAERVSDRTALTHRVLRFDEHGDAAVTIRRHNGQERLHLWIGAAELRLIAREARREARRRLFARLRSR